MAWVVYLPQHQITAPEHSTRLGNESRLYIASLRSSPISTLRNSDCPLITEVPAVLLINEDCAFLFEVIVTKRTYARRKYCISYNLL